MKKVVRRTGLLWYGVFFLIALGVVFFVGTKVTPGTGETNTILTFQGVNHFKKGLDLAGGVRLTYKIDFSKYEQTYANNPSQLLQVKKMAQDIILKNIDKRISTLGVSDYNAYVQKLTDGDYVNVEIGGVQDVDAAKKLIGKTVELEFKVPTDSQNPDATARATREDLAKEIYTAVKKDPTTMQELASSRGSQDVYYNHFSDATLNELPYLYRNNIDALTSVESGEVYPSLFSGVYHVISTQTETGGLDTQVLQGFTMVQYLGKKETTNSTVSLTDVLAYATSHNIDVKQSIVRTHNGDVQTVAYDASAKSVVYVGEEILPQQAGYNISVYQIASGDQSDAVVQKVQDGKVAGLTLFASGWKTADEVKQIVPSFTYDANKKVSLYKELDATYVIAIHDSKVVSDTIYPSVSIPADTADQGNTIVTALTHKILYSFNDIYVADALRWTPAEDPKTSAVLNGAFFKYAAVSQSQAGKPVVSIQFDDQGKDIFCNLTEQYIGKQMAIFVGGKLMTAPVIRDKICGGSAQIDGAFDIKGAKKLADDLNSGALPAPLLLSHEETIAPSLGQNALRGALFAGLVGIVVVYFFMMMLYGWKKANIALAGLIVFLVYLLGIIKLLGIVSSLSGIAAIILSLGMAVDANVLMYERIREELSHGKGMDTAIEDGYARSWAPIRDGNVTTGIIGLLLFLVGVNVFKGFGTMMLIDMLLILGVVTPLTKKLLRAFYLR